MSSETRIVVISDTHLMHKNDRLPPVLERVLAESRFFVHCGDFETLFAYEQLNKLGKMIAVHGNMDSYELKRILPEKTTFEVGGYKIGLTHGSGSPKGIEARVAKEFEGVDVILYGHSHRPQNEFRDKILFFNPGSPTDRMFAPFTSYGIITLGPEGIKGEIIRI